MAKIAILITDLFEDVEYQRPAEAFERAGHILVHVGLRAGEVVKGKRHGLQVTVDRVAGDVTPEEFDALFIPGGYSPDRLRAHDEVVEFVRAFVASGKPVLMICHAPQLLITADVLRGRRVTGYKSIIQDLKNAGADYVDAPVVIDGPLLSSRDPRDVADFTKESLAMLDRAKAGRAVAA